MREEALEKDAAFRGKTLFQRRPHRVILSERSESNCEAVRGVAEQDLGGAACG